MGKWAFWFAVLAWLITAGTLYQYNGSKAFGLQTLHYLIQRETSSQGGFSIAGFFAVSALLVALFDLKHHLSLFTVLLSAGLLGLFWYSYF